MKHLEEKFSKPIPLEELKKHDRMLDVYVVSELKSVIEFDGVRMIRYKAYSKTKRNIITMFDYPNKWVDCSTNKKYMINEKHAMNSWKAANRKKVIKMKKSRLL